MRKKVANRIAVIAETSKEAAELFTAIYKQARKDRKIDADEVEVDMSGLWFEQKEVPVFSLRKKGTYLDYSVWLVEEGEGHAVKLYSELSDRSMTASTITDFDQYVSKEIMRDHY